MATIITITGDLGSGKSTVSGLLQKHLKYDYIYTGKIMRELADKYNMTTIELNKYAETHPEIDEEIDSTFKSLNNSSNLIVDSRLAWFFIPQSFKVFLKTNLVVSAHRISNDNQRINERYSSKEEAAHKIIERKASENKRYMDLYGANCADITHFNLIIDTSFINPQKAADIILAGYKEWLTSTKFVKAYISPLNLYPTKTIRGEKDDCGMTQNEIWGKKDDCGTMQNEIWGKKDDCGTTQNEMKEKNPVSIVSVNGFDYIVHGHKAVSCAIKNRIDLLPVNYIDENSVTLEGTTCKEEIINTFDRERLKVWEFCHSFEYKIYPVL